MTPLGYQTNLMVPKLRGVSSRAISFRGRAGIKLCSSLFNGLCTTKVMKDGGYAFGDFTKYGGVIQAHGRSFDAAQLDPLQVFLDRITMICARSSTSCVASLWCR